jgi:protein YIPF1/2
MTAWIWSEWLIVGGFTQGTTSQTAPTGKRMLWSIEYYAQYFDVDTKQVLDRCWAAIFPKTPFLDVLGGNPDLYGTYSPCF